MPEETIVAVFDTAAHAEIAVRDLRAADVPEHAIGVHAADRGAAAIGSDTTDLETGRTGGATGMTFAEPAGGRGFWSNLFGGETDHDDVYDRSVEGGSTVVTVKVMESEVAEVIRILESHNPVDVEERASSYGLRSGATSATTATADAPLPVASQVAPTSASTSTSDLAAPARDDRELGRATGAGDEVIPLTAEELVVGKRLVNRGSTRVRRFVVETPVEREISLHDERVVVERRPVTDGRPVAEADFTDKVVEMTESAEVPVVTKTARVVEEVSLHKEAVDRVETVRDTVRREDVEIEKVPGRDEPGLGATEPSKKI